MKRDFYFIYFLYFQAIFGQQEWIAEDNQALFPSFETSISQYSNSVHSYFSSLSFDDLSENLQICHDRKKKEGEGKKVIIGELEYDEEEKKCQFLEYLYHLQNDLNKHNRQQRNYNGSANFVGREVELISPSYEQLFENYILKGRSFKGQTISSKASSLLDCHSLERHPITGDFPIKTCNNSVIFNSLEIPSIAYNSYNPRLPSRSSSLDPIDSILLDLSSHWPVITRISNLTNHNHTMSCPYNMHMILWGPKESLSIKILNISTLPLEYSSHLGDKILHYHSYNLTYDAMNLTWIPYETTSLLLNEYLFIPFNSLAVINQPDNNTDLFKLCYFDASNLNQVRSALTIESYLSSSSKQFIKLLSSPNLFDYTMKRHTSHTKLSYSLYMQHPKSTISEGGRGEEEEEREGEGIKSSDVKIKNNRRNRGKNDFKEWQDVARWNQMIASLVIPQTPVPNILQIHRRNISITWEAVYYPTSQDRTAYGVNITICHADVVLSLQAKGLLSSSSSVEDEKAPSCRVITHYKKHLIEINKHSNDENSLILMTHIRDLEPSMEYKIRLTTFYGESGSLPSSFTASLRTLPDLPPSPPLPPFTITPSPEKSTTVLLSFHRPSDDGGHEILGYHIFTRHTHRNHHKHWVWNGIYEEKLPSSSSPAKLVHIEISHLLPRTEYQFAISCFNILGNSSMIIIPNKITTGDTGTGILAGHNHRSRFQSSSFLKALQNNFHLFDQQPTPRYEEFNHSIVTINDELQSLSYYDSETKKVTQFEVWDCHWSPRLFLVKGEVVWTIPPLADHPILSSISSYSYHHDIHPSHLFGKIAVVWRGVIPIHTKALHVQRAGAIACLILDHGQCQQFNQYCIPGSDKNNGDRFAVQDDPSEWSHIKIPVILMKNKDVNQFLSLVKLPFYDELVKYLEEEKNKKSEREDHSEL